jgi:two-component system cell cycle response regulator
MVASRIMVVDGSGVSREIVARILANVIEKAEVTVCGSGQEALAALARDHYNLITTSLMLPDMDGLDLCRTIRQLEGRQATPIIVISGDADSRLLREGFAAGITDYFDKSQGYPAFGTFIKNFWQRNTGLVGRVLFVEDSQTAATVTRRMLERHGLQVTHVTSAEEALEHLDAMQQARESYDLVISDFYLQNELTGGDLLHAIRARYHLSREQLPVLIITGKEETQLQVETFHAGANDFINKPLVEEILMARVSSLLLIKHQYEALQRLTVDIEQVASSDALTGTRNRRYLLDHGPRMISRQDNQPLWVMLIDVDHIKQINDQHGQLVGDHVLAALGKTLCDHFPEGMVVRFGGEEFAVLLPYAQQVEALERAERLRQEVMRLKPDGVAVSVSIGMVCAAEQPLADLNQLIWLADKALFGAKEAGRNRIFINDSRGGPRAARTAPGNVHLPEPV